MSEIDEEVLPVPDVDEDVEDSDEDDGFGEYLTEQEDRQVAAEEDFVEEDEPPSPNGTDALGDGAVDFSKLSDAEWDALLAARSDTEPTEAEQREAFAEHKRQQAEAASIKQFRDWAEEHSRAQAEAQARLTPAEEPEEEPHPYADLSGLDNEAIAKLVNARIAEDKTYLELQAAGINPADLEYADPPPAAEPEIAVSEYTDMSDAQFAALIAKRDAERNY